MDTHFEGKPRTPVPGISKEDSFVSLVLITTITKEAKGSLYTSQIYDSSNTFEDTI